MKKTVKYFAITLCAFALGMAMNNIAVSHSASNIAVVDVNKVVASSSEVKKLKNEREAKIKDLTAYIKTARENIVKEKDAKKKKDLETKYTKELATKKAAIQKDYVAKLTAIDKSISAIIEQKAKAANYDIVLTKGVVLYGGTDITSEISKAVK